MKHTTMPTLTGSLKVRRDQSLGRAETPLLLRYRARSLYAPLSASTARTQQDHRFATCSAGILVTGAVRMGRPDVARMDRVSGHELGAPSAVCVEARCSLAEAVAL